MADGAAVAAPPNAAANTSKEMEKLIALERMTYNRLLNIENDIAVAEDDYLTTCATGNIVVGWDSFMENRQLPRRTERIFSGSSFTWEAQQQEQYGVQPSFAVPAAKPPGAFRAAVGGGGGGGAAAATAAVRPRKKNKAGDRDRERKRVRDPVLTGLHDDADAAGDAGLRGGARAPDGGAAAAGGGGGGGGAGAGGGGFPGAFDGELIPGLDGDDDETLGAGPAAGDAPAGDAPTAGGAGGGAPGADDDGGALEIRETEV